MRFEKLIPLEQTGQPSIRRIPVNLEQIQFILPTDNPGRSVLAMSGGAQIVVCHSELDLLTLIEGRMVININLAGGEEPGDGTLADQVVP